MGISIKSANNSTSTSTVQSNNTTAAGSAVVMPPANSDKNVWSWGNIPTGNYFVVRTTISPKGLAENLGSMGQSGKMANVYNGSLLYGRQFRSDNGTDFTVRMNILPMVRKDGKTVFDEDGMPKFVDSSQGINISVHKGFDIQGLDATTKSMLEGILPAGMKLEDAMKNEALKGFILSAVSSSIKEQRVDAKRWLMMLLGVKTEEKLIPSQLKVVLPRSLDFSEAFMEQLETIADSGKSAVLEVYVPYVAEARHKDLKTSKIKMGGVTHDVLDPDNKAVPEAQFTWGSQNIPVEGVVLKFNKSLGGVDTSRMYSNEYVRMTMNEILAMQNRPSVGAEVSLAEERIEEFFSPNGNKWHIKAGLLPKIGGTTCEYWEAPDSELPIWEKYMAKAIGVKTLPFEWSDRKAQTFNQQMMNLIIECRTLRNRAPWEECSRGIYKLGALVASTPVVPVLPEMEVPVVQEVKASEVLPVQEEVKTPEVKKEVLPVQEDEFVDELTDVEDVSFDDFFGLV